jgi:hypothetical protein
MSRGRSTWRLAASSKGLDEALRRRLLRPRSDSLSPLVVSLLPSFACSRDITRLLLHWNLSPAPTPSCLSVPLAGRRERGRERALLCPTPPPLPQITRARKGARDIRPPCLAGRRVAPLCSTSFDGDSEALSCVERGGRPTPSGKSLLLLSLLQERDFVGRHRRLLAQSHRKELQAAVSAHITRRKREIRVAMPASGPRRGPEELPSPRPFPPSFRARRASRASPPPARAAVGAGISPSF